VERSDVSGGKPGKTLPAWVRRINGASNSGNSLATMGPRKKKFLRPTDTAPGNRLQLKRMFRVVSVLGVPPELRYSPGPFPLFPSALLSRCANRHIRGITNSRRACRARTTAALPASPSGQLSRAPEFPPNTEPSHLWIDPAALPVRSVSLRF